VRELQISDCVYANGFPDNICWIAGVVVQIPETGQGIVIYTSMNTGKQSRGYLPVSVSKNLIKDIYIFQGEQ
jgi:hypothetical protein